MSEIKIVIADKQFLITESLRHLINSNPEFKVVSLIESNEHLQWQIQKSEADFLIIDYMSMELSSICDLQEIVTQMPLLKILVLVNRIEQADVMTLKNMGIQNILLKSTDRDDLFTALSNTAKGKRFYSESILEMLMDTKESKPSKTQLIQLTTTEKEIARMIVDGITTKEIAVRKFISFHTVMTHRKNIFKKLSINSTSELVMYAVKAGLVDTIEYHI